MSEAFEAKMMGAVAGIFLAVVTVWVLYSNYFLSLFEAALAAALSIIAAAFLSIRVIQANYNDVPAEDGA
jgi:ABC-type uncharacterized transport system permease subunit